MLHPRRGIRARGRYARETLFQLAAASCKIRRYLVVVLHQLEVFSLQLCQLRALRLQGLLQLGCPLAVPLAFLRQAVEFFLFGEEFLLDALKG